MADKVVALFVEGPTEIEFYKAVIAEARRVMQDTIFMLNRIY